MTPDHRLPATDHTLSLCNRFRSLRSYTVSPWAAA